MKKTTYFTPIANKDARILILGTMPGKGSLAFKEYFSGYRYTELIERKYGPEVGLHLNEMLSKDIPLCIP